MIARREVLGAAALLLPSAAMAAEDPIAALERSTGARIGVAAWDSGSGKTLLYRQDERFIPCSSFKLSLAALVLSRADAGREKLDRHPLSTANPGRVACHDKKPGQRHDGGGFV